jgi:hypothetical protein
MITERKIYITTDGIEFNEGDYPTPEKARADAERHEAEFQRKHSLIGKELFFRDENLNICKYDDATFVAVTTKEAINILEELCEEWGYYTPWGNCSVAFEAKAGFFMWSNDDSCWVDMDAEIERIKTAKATLIGEGKE